MDEIEFLKRQKYFIEITLELESEPDEEEMDQYDLYDVETTLSAPGDIAHSFSWLIFLMKNMESETDAKRIAKVFNSIKQAADDWAACQTWTRDDLYD